MAITMPTVSDDTGAGTDGTILNLSIWTSLGTAIDTAIAAAGAAGIQTTTSTGTQNNFALTAGVGFLRANNASLLTLTGIAAGVDGQLLFISSVGAGQVDLAHQNASSTAANRLINFATSASTSLAAGSGSALLKYDATTVRWRLVGHDQGAWITPTFAAGDYTANAGTWTVASGDRITGAYYLTGRTLTYAWWLNTTTTSGGMGADLRITLPFTSTKDVLVPIQTGDNNTSAIGLGITAAGSAILTLRKIDTSAWTSSVTDLTYVRGEITFEVT